MTGEVYDLGNKALQIVDDYMNANISGSDAVGKLDMIHDKLDRLYDKYDNEKTSTENLRKSLSTINIQGAVSAVKFDIKIDYMDLESGSYNELVKTRGKLAKLLNK
jgi:hypothetical protein